MKTFSQLIESIDEMWPGTKEYDAKFGKPRGNTQYRGNRHDITVKDGITRATRRVDATGDSEEPIKKVDIQDEPKRGRGRPPGKYGAYKKKAQESVELIKSMKDQREVYEFITNLDEESYLELIDFVSEYTHSDEQIMTEGGPFSYGKPLRAGSIADLAAKKRKEQERNKPPIEPKDQMVGNAKIIKSKTEDVDQQKIPESLSVESLAAFITANNRG